MSAELYWSKKYEVGLPEIDSQHEGLFEIAEKIQHATPETIRQYAMDLYKYTRVHFKAEEKFLEKIQYPEIEYHQSLHEDLVTELNEKADGNLDTPESIKDFKQFYIEWLSKHILAEDTKFVAYNQRRQIRLT
ncbi:MAG: hemerythrin domain-containing protein [Pontiellaceae bacterium]|nr:hemerythrin domain-containing protein [Pontiellaceae bacterium]